MNTFFANPKTRMFAICTAFAAACIIGVATYSRPNASPEIEETNLSETSSNPEYCNDLISSALDMLQPDRLGVTSEAKDAADLLNSWLASCGASGPENRELKSSAAVRLETLISFQELEQLKETRFTKQDAGHLRNSLLSKTIVNFVLSQNRNDLDRIVGLFEYVVRNIGLEKEGEQTLPLSPYEIVLFGRGTPEDRAWIFAMLLRQLHVDAVILRPSSQDDASKDRWLVGVRMDGRVYLFDTRLGCPVPSSNDDGKTTTIENPATLTEVQENDKLLRLLDLEDRPYPLNAGDLKSPRVEVIGNSSLWAPHMKRIQMSLVGERSVVIYDGLQDGGTGEPGSISRVAKLGRGKWRTEDIGVWTYPNVRLQGFANLNDSQELKLLVRREPFKATIPWSDVAQGRINYGPPRREQLKTRNSQILGNYAKSIHSYMNIRLRGKLPRRLRPNVRRMHARAAEDAFFWIGVCQLEQQDYVAASGTFREYLSSHTPGGAWQGPCRGLLALSLAEQKNYEKAIQVLEEAPSSDPQRDGFDLLIRRWRSASNLSEADVD